MIEMLESAPLEVGARRGYIRSAWEEVKTGVVEIVQKMFHCGPDIWEDRV